MRTMEMCQSRELGSWRPDGETLCAVNAGAGSGEGFTEGAD